MAAEGLVTVPSSFGPKDTMDRFEAAVKAKGLTVFGRIDHAAGAAAVGMPLRPTELLVFGNAKGGTPLMQASQATGIDLPLKALVYEVAGTSPSETTHRLLQKLSGPLGRYDGLGVMLGGLAIIIFATGRFIRTERLLDDPEMHSAGSARTELILSATLMLLVVGLSGYLVLG